VEKRLILDFRGFELKLCCVTLDLLLKFSEPHFPNLYLINLFESLGSFIHHAFITYEITILHCMRFYMYKYVMTYKNLKKVNKKNSVIALILKLKDIKDHNDQKSFLKLKIQNLTNFKLMSHIAN